MINKHCSYQHLKRPEQKEITLPWWLMVTLFDGTALSFRAKIKHRHLLLYHQEQLYNALTTSKVVQLHSKNCACFLHKYCIFSCRFKLFWTKNNNVSLQIFTIFYLFSCCSSLHHTFFYHSYKTWKQLDQTTTSSRRHRQCFYNHRKWK